MSRRSQRAPGPEEETPLLRDENPPRKETPLPITQIVVLLLLQLTEPITSLSIRPYINQLVSELPIVGGDERKVGYYAGLIVSLYFAAQAVSVLQWSRLSDNIGRKPVLLCGLLGTMVSSVLFGLSRSFPALVFSRCFHGMLNGNVGVMKSMMAELTDETNVARGSSLISVTWAIGCVMGPFIGGVLSRPQDRWPNVFSHPFWGEYPYFLPCLATASYALLSFSLAAIFLKETVKRNPVMKLNPESNSDLPRVGAGEVLDGPVKDAETPVPLRALLTRPVVVSVANYGMIGMLDMTAGNFISLVWSTSVEFGGLSMSPASIGLWMAGYGLMEGVFQFVAFPRIVRRFGPRRVFIAGIILFAPVYTMLPLENLVLRHSSHDMNLAVGLLIVLQFSALNFSGMGFGAIFMYISSAAPNKRSLGATNGIAQTIVSIQRTVGPAAAASLFAFSLDHNILGGNFAYVMLLAIVGVGLGIAVQLPNNTWVHNETRIGTIGSETI
ncbi:MFS general substrate transporter [Lactarius akahatsu]|uniref:MFS general substrate transporter n=1 Tax=Lactarius akahatsu TaxID=416441 RepID=A0AAD4LFC0_9AGAM|nr:MFS general substrate transporter [Lactarius akahatsu]